jgi:VWFA-related protein
LVARQHDPHSLLSTNYPARPPVQLRGLEGVNGDTPTQVQSSAFVIGFPIIGGKMSRDFIRRRDFLRRLLCLTGVGLICLCAAVVAQEVDELVPTRSFEVAPEFHDRVEVHLGSVDVTVLDKKTGHAVSGLTREAFALVVDDQPLEISNFSAYGAGGSSISITDTRAPAEAAPEPPPPTPVPRPQLFVFFIDNENLSRFNRNIVLDRLETFVAEHVYPPHRGLVVTNNMGLRRVGEATSNAAEILGSLESLVGSTTGATKVRTHTRFAESRIRELAEMRRNSNTTSRLLLDQALSTARMNSAQIDEALVRGLDNLKTLIRTIGGAPGRKDILYVSDGLPMAPGKAMFLLIDELFQTREGIQQTRELERISLFMQVVGYARAADTTVHTIDASGLKAVHGSKADTSWYRSPEVELVRQENYQAPLFFIAEQTGGLAVANTNEIKEGIMQVGGAARTYYSLGFPLEPPLQNRTHKVAIRLLDHPDYVLRYRPVFRERTAATRAAERTMTGLLLVIDDNAIGIVAEAGDARPIDKNQWTIPVLVHAPLSGLTLLPSGEMMTGRVSAFSVAGSDDGAKSTVQHSSQEIRTSAQGLDDVQTITFKIEIHTAKGADRVSVGLLDETSGATGFTVVDVVIPDDKQKKR